MCIRDSVYILRSMDNNEFTRGPLAGGCIVDCKEIYPRCHHLIISRDLKPFLGVPRSRRSIMVDCLHESTAVRKYSYRAFFRQTKETDLIAEIAVRRCA